MRRGDPKKISREIRFALDYPDYVLNHPEKYGNFAAPPAAARWLAPGWGAKGYGNSKYWPFSVKKALKEPGYLKGIERALNNDNYDESWKANAKHLLRIVYHKQAMLEQAYRDIIAVEAYEALQNE